jgi:glycosyltransferase involved in cell wall biosynthesis
MRISLLGPTYPYRGGIAHHMTLLEAELRHKHEVQFISFRRQYPRWLFPGRSDRDPSDRPLRPQEVEYMLDPLNPVSWRATTRVVASFDPELLVLPWWVAFWAPSFGYVIKSIRRSTRAQVHVICHNVMEHEASRLKTWATRRILGLADRVITHGREETEALDRLLNGGPEIITAFHPTYAPLAGEMPGREVALEELGVAPPVLLFFGFVRPYKGLEVLLRALPEVRRDCDATLLVVGEFWGDKRRYDLLIRELDLTSAVRIVDRYVPNEELGRYFAAADLVVQPYLSVTGSGASQLAYGFDRPVIATEVGSLPKVIDDGVNGRVVPAGDSHALARAVVESLEPATLQALKQQARLTKERFSWQRFAELVISTEPTRR